MSEIRDGFLGSVSVYPGEPDTFELDDIVGVIPGDTGFGMAL